MSTSAYFTKLTKLWDELALLTTLPKCSCGSSPFDGPSTTIGKLIQCSRELKQREVHASPSQDGAMIAKFLDSGKQAMKEGGQRRKGLIGKRSKYCDHCKRSGHTRESCFKLTGYPEWYKNLMDQRRNAEGTAGRIYNVDLEAGESSSCRTTSVVGSNLCDLIRLEIRRMMQGPEHIQEHDTNLWTSKFL
ncbi:UNVERIFIED_CONTAM: hypothetical protein Slati_3499500 [Sesamum latifolium]|uniref:Gag-pol polyprotein n=1 Tax=Sesamum latifolium TaxID=2727402 RepID=A0AAW2UH41_9LAMI